MNLRTWISNLSHRLIGMEADSVNPHVLAAFTDIQWALRELVSREEGAQARQQPWDPSRYGMPDAKPSEKPQAVADADVAEWRAAAVRYLQAAWKHINAGRELELPEGIPTAGRRMLDEAVALIARRVAEAKTAAREEALREARRRLSEESKLAYREHQESGLCFAAVVIDEMLARPSGEAKP
jgi:hypothetical protein